MSTVSAAFGSRAVGLHLKGLVQLGTRVSFGHGSVELTARGTLWGARIYLDLPSVQATEHLTVTAAARAMVIENAAEEPEAVDLANFLCALEAV